MQISVTIAEYLRLQYFYKAASMDFSRISITKAYYHSEMDCFVATDGHVFRCEKIDWGEHGKPETSFFLEKNQVMLTEKQLALKYADMGFFNPAQKHDLKIPIDYIPASEHPCNPFPNLENVIPKLDAREAIECVGISPAIMKKFLTTFWKEPDQLRFVFGGKLKGILIHTKFKYEEDWRFSGIIMPSRLNSGDLDPVRVKTHSQEPAIA